MTRTPPAQGGLTHIGTTGEAHMVDVGDKAETVREAVAEGTVHMQPATLAMIVEGNAKKGDVLGTARIAGIMAAKKAHELIPLCHPIPVHQIDVNLKVNPELPGVEITARVRTYGKTGVEMEALTAVSVAALTVYDMVKAVEKTGRIQNVRLIEKHGGLSGDLYNE